MNTKSAALLAGVGMVLLTVLILAQLIQNIAAILNGLIPALDVLKSLIYLVAALTVTVFFFVFYKRQA